MLRVFMVPPKFFVNYAIVPGSEEKRRQTSVVWLLNFLAAQLELRFCCCFGLLWHATIVMCRGSLEFCTTFWIPRQNAPMLDSAGTVDK
jgi:hypothetical protein